MDPVTLGLIIGGSSMIGDFISQYSESKNAKRIKQQTIDAYKRLLIPYAETKSRADRAGDTVYTKAMSELNSGAFQYAGALNSNVLSALAISKMVNARQSTAYQTEQQDLNYNRELMQKAASAEAMPEPEINIGKTLLTGLEEGLGGYLAGKQLQMTEELNEKMMAYYNTLEGLYGSENKQKTLVPNNIDTLLKKKKNKYSDFINDYDLQEYGFTRFSKFF